MTLAKHTEPGKQACLKEHSDKVWNSEDEIKAFWVTDKLDCFNLSSEDPAARILERLSLNK